MKYDVDLGKHQLNIVYNSMLNHAGLYHNLIALTATSWPLLQLWWPLLQLWMALTATSLTQRWPLLQLPVIFKYLIV